MLTCAECLPSWFEVITLLLSFSFRFPMGPSPVLAVHVTVKDGGLSFLAPVSDSRGGALPTPSPLGEMTFGIFFLAESTRCP